MFQIDVNDPAGTIAGAMTALNCKSGELAELIGTSPTQLSRAKKAERLPSVLEAKFRAYVEANGDEPVPASGSSPEVSTSTINIELLQTDDSIQQRADHTNLATVVAYEQAAERSLEDTNNPWPFPPVVVFRDGEGKHWLADGFHRVEVAIVLGIDQITADVRTGGRRDALLFAAGTNAEHGLPRTNADKRKAVRTLIEDSEWSEWSNREIARRCRVHHELVGTVRKELAETASEIDEPQTIAVTVTAEPREDVVITPRIVKAKDGRQMNIGNISTANKARTKAPKTQAKQIQEAINRFAGACSDIREVDLTETERFNIAARARDTFIWVLGQLPQKDAAAMLAKVNGKELH